MATLRYNSTIPSAGKLPKLPIRVIAEIAEPKFQNLLKLQMGEIAEISEIAESAEIPSSHINTLKTRHDTVLLSSGTVIMLSLPHVICWEHGVEGV